MAQRPNHSAGAVSTVLQSTARTTVVSVSPPSVGVAGCTGVAVCPPWSVGGWAGRVAAFCPVITMTPVVAAIF